jgi:hypothetical protein
MGQQMKIAATVGDWAEHHMDRIYKSYVRLGMIPRGESGSRTIPISHFGSLEVRLMEFANVNRPENFDLWIELYRHDTQSSIDSCLCRDLDELETVGGYLFSQAKELYESSGVSQ